MESLTPEQRAELVTLTRTRIKSSEDYYQSRLDAFIRFWKIYLSIKDAVDNEDETNTGAAYAFGVIEDVVASISESILNMRVPTAAKAKKVADEKPAENFNAMAATYFSSGQYQSEYPGSVREGVVCGPRWEFDGWACDYRKARRWAKNEIIINGQPTGQMKTEEVEYEEAVRVGYFTRFPSIFLMRPQPFVESVEKMKWCGEIEERKSLEDMRLMQYIDHETNEKRGFFDLSEIEKDKEAGATIRPEVTSQSEKGKDWQAEYRALMDGVSQKEEDKDDTDMLTLVWMWEPDRVWCVANGKYVVAYVEKLFQKDGIPYRLKNCTPRKHSLYGMGFIEPVEKQFYELDDIHILSMRNWVRIINKMLAYNPESVKAEDMASPRAGGKVRVTPPLGQSVSGQIHDISQENVTRDMLAAESNIKGLVERGLGMPDFAAGVEGTKQSHETLGGIQEIKAQSAKRVAMIRRQELAGFQKQMWRMEAMFSQFQVEKGQFSYYGPDGSTAMLELDLWDIDTQGRGFDFPIVYDPAMGDDALMRNQRMVYYDAALKHNQAVMSMAAAFPPGKLPLVDLGVIFADLSKPFGYSDTSKIFMKQGGIMSPEDKLQAMMRGQPVAVTPEEDLVACYVFMVQAMGDPGLAQAVEAGQAPADLPLRIKTHIEALRVAIMQVLQNPQALIRAKMFAAQGAAAGAPPPGGPKVGAAPTGDRRDKGVAKSSPSAPPMRGRA